MIARKTAGWAVLVIGIVAVVFSIAAISSTEDSSESLATERVDDREDQTAHQTIDETTDRTTDQTADPAEQGTTVETARQKALREKLVVPKIDRNTHADATIPLPEVAEGSEDD